MFMFAKTMYLMYCTDVRKRKQNVTSNNMAVNWFSFSPEPPPPKYMEVFRYMDIHIHSLGTTVEVVELWTQ